MYLKCAAAAISPTASQIFANPFGALRDPAKYLGSNFFQNGIRIYRADYSHLKGYKCASGVLGGHTCSTVGLKLFKRFNVVKAAVLMNEQFQKCKRAADVFNTVANQSAQGAASVIKRRYGLAQARAVRMVQVAQTRIEEHRKNRTERRAERKRSRDGWVDCCASSGDAVHTGSAMAEVVSGACEGITACSP